MESPTPTEARRKLTPEDAVLAELRALLNDLADALLSRSDTALLQDTVRHAWVLVDLAGVPEGLVRVLLRNLARDLRDGSADHAYYAQQIQNAMDRLW